MALLEAEYNIATTSHVVIQVLVSNASGSHYALKCVHLLRLVLISVCCRVQVSPKVEDVFVGDIPEDKYYFYDGMNNDGKFTRHMQDEWARKQKCWLVTSMGACTLNP